MEIFLVKDGKLVRYKRTGQCNQCGECCRHTIVQERSVQYGRTADDTKLSETHECDYSSQNGGVYIWYLGCWWYFKTIRIEEEGEPCSQLCGTNLCKVWTQPQKRKAICYLWPYHPDDILLFPKCGYKFERIEDEDTKGS